VLDASSSTRKNPTKKNLMQKSHTYMQTHTHVQTHTHTHIHANTHTCKHRKVRLYARSHTRSCSHTCTITQVLAYIYSLTNAFTCKFAHAKTCAILCATPKNCERASTRPGFRHFSCRWVGTTLGLTKSLGFEPVNLLLNTHLLKKGNDTCCWTHFVQNPSNQPV
jgi:hypothetical protein